MATDLHLTIAQVRSMPNREWIQWRAWYKLEAQEAEHRANKERQKANSG